LQENYQLAENQAQLTAMAHNTLIEAFQDEETANAIRLEINLFE